MSDITPEYIREILKELGFNPGDIDEDQAVQRVKRILDPRHDPMVVRMVENMVIETQLRAFRGDIRNIAKEGAKEGAADGAKVGASEGVKEGLVEHQTLKAALEHWTSTSAAEFQSAINQVARFNRTVEKGKGFVLHVNAYTMDPQTRQELVDKLPEAIARVEASKIGRLTRWAILVSLTLCFAVIVLMLLLPDIVSRSYQQGQREQALASQEGWRRVSPVIVGDVEARLKPAFSAGATARGAYISQAEAMQIGSLAVTATLQQDLPRRLEEEANTLLPSTVSVPSTNLLLRMIWSQQWTAAWFAGSALSSLAAGWLLRGTVAKGLK